MENRGTMEMAIADAVSKALSSMNLDNCNFKQRDVDIEKEFPMINMTLADYLDYWMVTYKEKSVKASTYDRLITSVRSVKRYPIVQMKIGDITADHIQDYVNTLSTKLSYSGVLKMMRIVTAPLSKAAALHQIPSNPAVGIELPNRDHVAKKPRDTSAYSPDEQIKLRRVLETRDRHGYIVILFMMETGLRIGEALALDWSDVNFKRNGVKIHKTVENLANKKQQNVREGTKSFSSNRFIPLTPGARSILDELHEYARHEWVFCDDCGMRITYEAVRYQTKIACKEAGIQFKGEHVFRHTFATNSYHKNIDVKLLSKMLGHSSTAITMDTYVNLYGDGFDELQQAFGNL